MIGIAAFDIIPLGFAVAAGILYRRGLKEQARVLSLLAIAVATSQVSRVGDNPAFDAASIVLTLSALVMAWRYHRGRARTFRRSIGLMRSVKLEGGLA